jgi:hypothetical protein
MENQIAVMKDRRKHARLKLRIPVLLWAESKNPVRSETMDISSDGFYCTTSEPFAPGDRLRCLLSIQVPFDSMESELTLDAEIEVMRVLIDNDTAGFGLGCRIAEYHVVNKQTALKWPLSC